MNQKSSIDQLQAEYFHLQGVIETFDARALTIKAWSVTVSATALAAAYVEAEPLLLPIAAVTALAFWLVESLWKVNQQAFYPRILSIEAAMRDPSTSIVPLQIADAWIDAYRAQRQSGLLQRVVLWPHVFLPHIIVVAVALALFILAPPTTAVGG